LLLREQRLERSGRAASRERDAKRQQVALETEHFLERYVAGGLEAAAADLDNMAHLIDRAYRSACRNRDLARALSTQAATNGGDAWERQARIQSVFGDVRIPTKGFGQAALLPFPGDFMQSLLALNRCVALASDWLERYPWTATDRLPAVRRFLDGLQVTLPAAARWLESAAACVRQLPARPYLEWFPIVMAEPRLMAISIELKAVVDRQLQGAPADGGSRGVHEAAV
jgi:hypothetical protein